MGNLKPKIALLVQLFIPIAYLLAYFFILIIPKGVHRPGWHPQTWIVPEEVDVSPIQRYFFILIIPKGVHRPGWHPQTWIVPEEVDKPHDFTGEQKETILGEYGDATGQELPQRKMTFIERVRHIVPLLHLMIPLSVVYIAEYLINQGVNQLIIFNCHEGFHLTLSAQYRWYQVNLLIVL
ncbi:unnamed protein product [Strongylus vulgaris]|uniref:Battenin n=1 Tax=Strongylus vulgaris TaxID=40348 RepID=A0A3P7J6N6_STRVU|nr:unnamed protein product [Strongylus vulgaris]